MSHRLLFHIRGIRLHFTREFLVKEGEVLRIGRIDSNDLVIKDQEYRDRIWNFNGVVVAS